MRLSPNKVGVDETNLVESFQPLETERHQLPRLERARDPLHGRVQVALAEPAEVEDDLLGDVLGDVDLGAEAGDARVGRVRLDRNAALTTKAVNWGEIVF